MTEEVRLKLDQLPDSPGCYIMKSCGQVIYVGKAKNLKNRVRQYFHASADHTAKVQAMVDKIDDFDIVLVSGELEALILECNLIKLHKPFYNILLKDDKHYPYIRIDMNDPFPRLELVRKSEKDGAKYFGPYLSATVVREVLDVARMIFPIRTCKRSISPGRPVRPCVHYEVGQCLGPCGGHIDSATYREIVEKAIAFLSGKYEPLVAELNEKMRDAAINLNYERASLYRDRLQAVEQVMEKQRAIVAGGGDSDVAGVLMGEDDALVQLMMIRAGKLIGTETHVMERAGDTDPCDVLETFLMQYYSAERLPPSSLLLSCEPPDMEVLSDLFSELRGGKVTLFAPKRGEKRQLVELALKNARDAAQKREAKLSQSHARTIGALEELQAALELEQLPERIECYDISNTQGELSVGSMVVAKNGVNANRDYRRFRIRTVEGANDFASMKEVVLRRFRHGLTERDERLAGGQDPRGGKFSDLPDLVIIDGGHGQLSAALEAMSELGVAVPAFGLAKRIEEIVTPEGESILLDRHSEALKLLQRLRDEAHRFAITYHRSLRGAEALKSVLDGIPGVGPVRKRALQAKFDTLEALKEASIADICEAQGISTQTAQAIYDHLHKD